MTSKADTWMPFDIGAYLRDTSRLTTEAHGAYMLMLMDYWVKGPIPDDDEQLAAITKLGLPRWQEMRRVLAPFFRIENGQWHQKRADHERQKAAAISAERSAAGQEGARRRWQKPWQDDDKSHGNSMHLNRIHKTPISPPSGDSVASQSGGRIGAIVKELKTLAATRPAGARDLAQVLIGELSGLGASPRALGVSLRDLGFNPRNGRGGAGNGSANGGDAMAGGGVIPEDEQARLKLVTKYQWVTINGARAKRSKPKMIAAMQADGLDPAVIDWVCGIAPAPAVIPDV